MALTVERDLGKRRSAQRFPGGLLTRKGSQVQTLSRPPLFSLVKDLSAPRGQRSLRAAAAPRPQSAPPPNRVGPPELDATGPPSANDHAAWSPPLGPGPLVSTTPASCPGRPAGPVSTCSVPCSPASRPASWPWTSARVGRWGQGGAAAGTPAKRRPWARGRPSCEPATATAAPSLSRQDRCGQATTPPADHGGMSTRCARPGRPATPSQSGVQRADRAAAAPRTPERVRPDTRMPRTPGHRTRGCWMSARPVGRTSPRRTGRGGQGNDRPGRRPDILATGDTPWAARPRPGSPRLGALGHPRRLRGDGTCATALTAATGQLPSTARHEAAPRRTALLGRFSGRA